MIEYEIRIRTLTTYNNSNLDNIILKIFIDLLFKENNLDIQELQHHWVELPLPEETQFLNMEEIPEETLIQWSKDNLRPDFDTLLNDFSFRTQNQFKGTKDIPYSLIK